ncbi:ribonuclease t2, partial [Clonorchis sinensis]
MRPNEACDHYRLKTFPIFPITFNMNPFASHRSSLLTFLLVPHLYFLLQMSFSAYLLLVCFLPSLISPDGISPTHWDYLILSLRWPATLCNFTECSVIPQPVDFLIHGLWPTREPNIEPEKCDSAPTFDVDQLKV